MTFQSLVAATWKKGLYVRFSPIITLLSCPQRPVRTGLRITGMCNIPLGSSIHWWSKVRGFLRAWRWAQWAAAANREESSTCPDTNLWCKKRVWGGFVKVLEAGELWVYLDKENFMQSIRKRGVAWQRLGVLQLGPRHIHQKDQGM